MERIFRVVATGGTFDGLHKGHRALLDRAFEVGDRVIIGLSSDELAQSMGKVLKSSYEPRLRGLRTYLDSRYPGRKYEIHELFDYFGPGVQEPEVEAIVVSSETKSRVNLANKMRRQRGAPPLRTVQVSVVLAEDGKPISSTRIRAGEITEEGRLIRA